MDDHKNNITLRRRGAVLLATLLCVSALAGCAGQTQTAGKQPTEQTQQAAPKTDAGKNDAGKNDAGKNDAGKKDSGKNDAGKKDSGKSSSGKSSSGKKDAGKSNPGKNNAASTQKPAETKSAPSIKMQPNGIVIASGNSVTFTVAAKGTEPLQYAWQVDKNDGKGWTDIPGATNAAYTVEKAGKEQNGWKFRCVVSNSVGKTESNAATLTIRDAAPDSQKADSGKTDSQKADSGKKDNNGKKTGGKNG